MNGSLQRQFRYADCFHFVTQQPKTPAPLTVEIKFNGWNQQTSLPAERSARWPGTSRTRTSGPEYRGVYDVGF